MKLRGGTVGAYLSALRDAAAVPGATEHTLRPPLVARLVAGAHTVSAGQRGALENLLAAFFSARAPITTSAEQLAGGLARKTTLLRDAIRALLGTPGDDGEALRRLAAPLAFGAAL